MRTFAAAWRFLTIIPVPWPAGDDEVERLRDAPSSFPFVGLVLGALACVFVAALSRLLPRPVVAALATALLAGFSGGLHLDGLADSADGLFSARDRERMLAIMKDSRIGTHGAAFLILLLLTKFACLASLPAEILPGVCLLIPATGRAAMLPLLSMLPYARSDGLGKLFESARGSVDLTAQAVVWVGVLWFAAGGVRGFAVGLGVWLAVTAAWMAFLRRRLGGATGDCYGAACELGELSACLAAAALAGHLYGL